MGLLDDAIRDHLELKRRHGADPSEVADQEREALGPARREAPPAPEGPAAAGDAEDEYEPVPGDAVVETTDEEEPLYDDLDEDDEFEEEEEEEEEAGPGGAQGASPADEPRPDDVLEETPEFLQETPEHDRLWFEQKPPRDFDF